MPLRILDTSDISPESRNIPAVLQYDAAAGRFRLKQIVNNSSILSSAAEDGDIPDTLIAELEENIQVEAITDRNYDGGSF